jgi:dipeptidyl aminopeptidase/acylaminoacyl peptidase
VNESALSALSCQGRRQALAMLLLAVWLLAASPINAQRTSAPPTARDALRVEDALAVRTFADRQQVSLSSDGELVAFALVDPGRAARLAEPGRPSFTSTGVPGAAVGTDVFVANTRTGVTRDLTAGRGSSWAPTWSPDGRYLAFYSDRDGIAQLWLWDRVRDKLRRLTTEVVRPFWGFEQPQWSPDGRRILVKLLLEGQTLASARRLLPEPAAPRSSAERPRGTVTATVFSSHDSTGTRSTPIRQPIDSTRSFLNAALGDLALVDAESGRVLRVAPWVRAMAARFSPDGARIAFTVRQPYSTTGELSYGLYDLLVVDTTARDRRLIASRLQQSYGQSFSWSPSGRSLAYASGPSLRVVAVADTTRSTRFAPEIFSASQEYRAPLWLDDEKLVAAARDTLWMAMVADRRVSAIGTVSGWEGLEIFASADAGQIASDNAVILSARDPVTKRMGFHSVDLSTGRSVLQFQGDLGIGNAYLSELPYAVSTTPDRRHYAFVAESADRPPEVWIAHDNLVGARRLTNLNPAVVSRRLGRSRLVRWQSRNGDLLDGALLLPSSYQPDRRYPLIVRVYGGSRLSWLVNRFGLESGVDNLQLLATRGYAVLVPDTPLRVGSPMADLAAAVLPALDTLVALGIADPERMGVFGHSYGGYSALALLVQTERFKAAAVSGSRSNLISVYADIRDDGTNVGVSWAERGQGRMGGTPWDFRERYIQNSPFFFLDRVATPLLMIHGGSDNPQAAYETFVALRRLGKDVVLVRYDNEGHWPGEWSHANLVDYWQRLFAWFGQHLQAVGR